MEKNNDSSEWVKRVWDSEFGGFKIYNLMDQYKIANKYYNESRLDEAKEGYLEILMHNPNLIDVHYNLALLYRDTKEYNKSIEQFKQVIKLNPKDADAYCELSKAFYESGKKEEAKSALEKTIELNPSHVLGYANLGAWYINESQIYINMGPKYRKELIEMLEKAKECCEKSLKLDPTNITAQEALRLTESRLDIFK